MSQWECDLLSHSLCTSCTNQGSLTSLLVVFWFVFWFAVVSVCCFGFALILFGMVMASLDCVLVLLQHGLLWPIFLPRWMNSNATINAKHAACKYSVWIDLAKAKRRREGKKRVANIVADNLAGQAKYCCVIGGQRMPRDVRLLLFGQNHWEIDLKGSYTGPLTPPPSLSFASSFTETPISQQLRAWACCSRHSTPALAAN